MTLALFLSATLPTIAGSLFAASCLGVASVSLLAWFKLGKQPILIGAAVFLSLLGYVGMVGASVLPGGPWYAIAAAPLALIVIRQIVPHLSLNRMQTIGSYGFIVMLGAILVAAPSAYAAYRADWRSTSTNQAEALLSMGMDHISEQEAALAESLATISHDPNFIAEIRAGNTGLLLGASQTQLAAHQLDNLTLVESDGTVLLRAHQPTLRGDNLRARYPWLARTSVNESVSGLGEDEGGRLSLIVAQPVLVDGSNQLTLVSSRHLVLPVATATGMVAVHSGASWLTLPELAPDRFVSLPGLPELLTSTPYGIYERRLSSGAPIALGSRSIPHSLSEASLWLVAISDAR